MSFWWAWAALRGLGWLFLLSLFPSLHFYLGFVAQNQAFFPVLKLLHILAGFFLIEVIPCANKIKTFRISISNQVFRY